MLSRIGVSLAATAALILIVVPAASAAKLKAPRMQSPAAGASAETVGSFTWRSVRRAVEYEFQVAADKGFGSIVDDGWFRTRNTAATVKTTVADGTYYWRVRAIGRNDKAGRWSKPRSLKKAWTTAPELLEPSDMFSVSWPAQPLVLRWTPVARATTYYVSIATDPSLSNPVVGTVKRPIETQGTVYGLQGALAPGRYFWAVTPVDAQGHPGRRSAVASFTWRWPTKLDERTQLRVADLDQDNGEVFDPQLAWTPIAGAARYQVEVSTAQVGAGTARSFPPGSVVCCSDRVTGTSLSPSKVLANNSGSGVPGDPEQFGYWWRVRAVDIDGNAGDWNYGPPFDTSYPAEIRNLRVRDNLGEAPVDRDSATAVVDTWAPAIVWDQVPGAASYEVRVVPYVQVPGTSSYVCNWSSTASDAWNVVTASAAWTPLGNPRGHRPTGVLTDLTPATDGLRRPNAGTSYCARVRARRDRDAKNREVVSDWTTIAGGTKPAFRYVAPPAPTGSSLTMSSANYLQPAVGQTHSWMPLYTWTPVDGARGYFVVVARDKEFTKIVDLAFTNVPVYAPRRNAQPWTYADETTSYWWAVVPSALADGDIAPIPPTGNSPRRFVKSSAPPQPISPARGLVVAAQPAFRWRPTLGARSYRLEVAQDRSFGEPIVAVTTASTGYTSSETLPADTELFWRVRANDETGKGLNWSATERFRRALPAPVMSPANPLGGEVIPAVTWSVVPGAVSYDMHVEQADGTKRDFNLRTTAFTPIGWYGTGVWTWRVRANFPGNIHGPFSAAQAYVRRLNAPAAVKVALSRNRMLFAWNPDRGARNYRLQIATSDSFGPGSVVETVTTPLTSYAPLLTQRGYTDGGKLWWRLAVVDEGRNVGAYTTGLVALPRAMTVSVQGSLTRRRRGTLLVTARDAKGRAVRKALVRASGVGARGRKRTNRQGVARMRVRASRSGTVTIRVKRRGFRDGVARVPVGRSGVR